MNSSYTKAWGSVIYYFLCSICSNYIRESIQNSLITRCFIELSRFFSYLYISWTFCSESARYCEKFMWFNLFINFLLHFILLLKYYSNAFFISGIKEERSDWAGIVSLNVNLVESLTMNQDVFVIIVCQNWRLWLWEFYDTSTYR